MNAADRIAEEAQRFLAGELDYSMRLRSADEFFWLYLSYQGKEIGGATFFRPFQYIRARRWLRRVVRGHQKLLEAAAREGVRYD